MDDPMHLTDTERVMLALVHEANAPYVQQLQQMQQQANAMQHKMAENENRLKAVIQDRLRPVVGVIPLIHIQIDEASGLIVDTRPRPSPEPPSEDGENVEPTQSPSLDAAALPDEGETR